MGGLIIVVLLCYEMNRTIECLFQMVHYAEREGGRDGGGGGCRGSCAVLPSDIPERCVVNMVPGRCRGSREHGDAKENKNTPRMTGGCAENVDDVVLRRRGVGEVAAPATPRECLSLTPLAVDLSLVLCRQCWRADVSSLTPCRTLCGISPIELQCCECCGTLLRPQ